MPVLCVISPKGSYFNGDQPPRGLHHGAPSALAERNLALTSKSRRCQCTAGVARPGAMSASLPGALEYKPRSQSTLTICHWLNCVPRAHVDVLTSRISECDFIWKQSRC